MCVFATGSEHFPPLGGYSDGQYRAAFGYATGTKVSWAEIKEMARKYAAGFGDRISESAGKSLQEAMDELFDQLINAEKTESGGRHAFRE